MVVEELSRCLASPFKAAGCNIVWFVESDVQFAWHADAAVR